MAARWPAIAAPSPHDPHLQVPFACSDDAGNGYRLCTFTEIPGSKRFGLLSSNVQAVDLYCDRAVLFGQPAQVAAAPQGTGQQPHRPPPPPPLLLLPGCCCRVAAAGDAAGVLLLLGCCYRAAAAGDAAVRLLLLSSCCWGAAAAGLLLPGCCWLSGLPAQQLWCAAACCTGRA
jgi:hypothetical protein